MPNHIPLLLATWSLAKCWVSGVLFVLIGMAASNAIKGLYNGYIPKRRRGSTYDRDIHRFWFWWWVGVYIVTALAGMVVLGLFWAGLIMTQV